MNHYKITFANGDSFITGFNGGLVVANSYYLNKVFNLGYNGNDFLVKCISVESIE